MEVRQLRAFVTVVDEGTFTDAAIALRTSQATVSRTVGALESELGVRLVRRTGRGVALTPEGRRALSHARRVLTECERLVADVAQAESQLRIGFAWAGLGRHNTGMLQRRWTQAYPGSSLVFVHASTPTAGLSEGLADVAVTRREPRDQRMGRAVIGVEARYAAFSRDDPLSRRRTVRLADFAGRVVGIDLKTGTTTVDLFPADTAPAGAREVHGIEEWLALIESGEACGMTTEATARQHTRPSVAYRRVVDAPSVPVWLVWWRDDPPARVRELVATATALYAETDAD